MGFANVRAGTWYNVSLPRLLPRVPSQAERIAFESISLSTLDATTMFSIHYTSTSTGGGDSSGQHAGQEKVLRCESGEAMKIVKAITSRVDSRYRAALGCV